MSKRYGALRFIATIYKVLGILAAIIAVLAALAVCASGALGSAALGNLGRDGGALAASGVVGGFVAGIVVVLYGAFLSLTLYAFGEGIYLLLALEENTRLTATILQKNLESGAPSAQASTSPALTKS